MLPTLPPLQQVFIPSEILYLIVSHLPYAGSDKNAILRALKACAVASRVLSRPARSILFRKVDLTYCKSQDRVAKLLDLLADSWLCYSIKEFSAMQQRSGSCTVPWGAAKDEELVAACLKRMLECGGLRSLTLGQLSWKTLSPVLRHEVALAFGATVQGQVRNEVVHGVDRGHTLRCLTLENVLDVPIAFLSTLPTLSELTLKQTTFSCKSDEEVDRYCKATPNLRSLTYDKGVLTNFYNDADAMLFSRLEKLDLLEVGKGVDMHTADMFLSATNGTLTALSLSTRHLKSDMRHWKGLQTSGVLTTLTSLSLSFPGPHHVDALDDVKTMLKQEGVRSARLKSLSLDVHIDTHHTEAEFIADHPAWRRIDRAIYDSFPQLEDCAISCTVEVVPQDWSADDVEDPSSTWEAMKKVHAGFARVLPSTPKVDTMRMAFGKVLGLESLQAFTWRHRISTVASWGCQIELSREYSPRDYL